MMKYLETSSDEEQLKGPKEFRLENKRPRGHDNGLLLCKEQYTRKNALCLGCYKHSQTNMKKTSYIKANFSQRVRRSSYLQRAANNAHE